MNIKYIKLLTPGDWLKIFLPVYLLLTLFFLKSFITDQVDRYFSYSMKGAKDIFDVRLGGDNAAFAKALAKAKGFDEKEAVNYSIYLPNSFIDLQRNEYKVVAAAVEKAAPKKSAEVKAELPPAPEYRVSSILVGKVRQFAVINDMVVEIGDKLSYGETITAIKDGQVLVKGKWGERWLFVNY